MPGSSHVVTSALLHRLPHFLLLSWALAPVFGNLGHVVDIGQLTVDIFCALINNICLPVVHFRWCGHLACRCCLRKLKALALSDDRHALLEYLVCVTFRIR